MTIDQYSKSMYLSDEEQGEMRLAVLLVILLVTVTIGLVTETLVIL